MLAKMKMKHNLLYLFLLFLLIILVGCSNSSVSKNSNSLKNNKENTVIDYLGREVTIPKKIDRIACLYAFSGHVVTMLGDGNKIVAVVNGLKRDTLLTDINTNIQNAIVPNRGDKINIEELAKVNPDLIFIQESTAKDEGEKRKLDEMKIPYLVVNFNSIKEQQQSISMIGKAIGKSEKAEKFNAFYNEMIQLVSKNIKNISQKNRIRVYHSVNEATRTDPEDSLPSEWIKLAGAVNVSVGENLKAIDEKYFASLEQILLWDPDVILVNEDGVSDYILKNSQWQTLKSVKNKKVYQLPNGVSRWGHPGGLETPLAIVWTAKTLYPEKFKDLNVEVITARFYKDFFDYELNEEMIQKILLGKDMRIPKEN